MPTDTPERLNFRKMERITRQVCGLLVELDGRELRRGSKERVCDTLDLEVRYMRRAFGPLWTPLLKRAGLSGVERRKDMTRLVESMLALIDRELLFGPAATGPPEGGSEIGREGVREAAGWIALGGRRRPAWASPRRSVRRAPR